MLFTLLALLLTDIVPAYAHTSADQHGHALACARFMGAPVSANLHAPQIVAYVGLGEDELAQMLTTGLSGSPVLALTPHRALEDRDESIEEARQDAWRRSVAGLIERRSKARGLQSTAYNEFVLRLIDEVFALRPGSDFVTIDSGDLNRAIQSTSLELRGVRPSRVATIDKQAFFSRLLGLDLTDARAGEVAVDLFAQLPRTTGAVVGVGQRTLNKLDPVEIETSERHGLLWSEVLALQVSSKAERTHLAKIFGGPSGLP